jgi:hypothetical protein
MKTLLLLTSLVCAAIASAQTTSIPDTSFEQFLIYHGCDTGPPDGVVTTASIDTIVVLNVQSKSISDLTGIEDFASLLFLRCYDNFLSSLDITQNFMLKELKCYENSLTSLDVSNNTVLSTLACGNNPLGSLDISQNTALNILHCNSAQISSLDVSQNLALQTLQCSDNDLTNLNVTQNTALKDLICFENQLTSLDFSLNPNLTDLQCYYNALTSLDLTNNGNLIYLACGNNLLTELNLTQNPFLETLHTVNNQLVCLNMRTGYNVSILSVLANDNPSLTCIEVDDDNYSTANWTDTSYFLFDSWASFSTNCNNTCTVLLDEHDPQSKKLIKVVDFLGRETKIKPNTPLIYIYNDGSTKRVFNVEN